jgi:octaprenyl-diphosphate synthase
MAVEAGASGLVLFVVLNDFSDDEVQKLLGEFGVEIGLGRQFLQPRDLFGFAGRVGGGQVVRGF